MMPGHYHYGCCCVDRSRCRVKQVRSQGLEYRFQSIPSYQTTIEAMADAGIAVEWRGLIEDAIDAEALSDCDILIAYGHYGTLDNTWASGEITALDTWLDTDHRKRIYQSGLTSPYQDDTWRAANEMCLKLSVNMRLESSVYSGGGFYRDVWDHYLADGVDVEPIETTLSSCTGMTCVFEDAGGFRDPVVQVLTGNPTFDYYDVLCEDRGKFVGDPGAQIWCVEGGSIVLSSQQFDMPNIAKHVYVEGDTNGRRVAIAGIFANICTRFYPVVCEA